MNARTKRLNQLRRKMNGSSSMINLKTGPYALCYYLYTMFLDKDNKRFFDSFDEAVKCLINCAKKLGKTDRLNKVLENEVSRMEKSKILTMIADKESAGEFDVGIPYIYIQDKKVDRELHNFDRDNITMINLGRILCFSDKPVFSSIINTAIFSSDESLNLCNKISLTKKFEKSIFDISPVKFLTNQVNLSEIEARLLLLKSRLENDDYLRDIMRNCENSDNKFRDCIADMIGVSEKELKYMLRSDQKLKEYGFLDNEGDYNSELDDCLEEQNIEPYFNDILKVIDCKDAYPLESYSTNRESIDVTIDLLKGENPVSILFYGKPGSGKTELAKSICKEAGKQVYIFKNESETEKDRGILRRLVCLLSTGLPDSILIVDEADTVLKTIDFSFFGKEPNKNKGTVNKMLENNKDKVIYIINHQHQIDESTLRRFTFSIKFEAMPQKMLHSIAESKIRPLNISDETKGKILDMLDKYKLTGASAENIAKVISGMNTQDEENLLDKVQIVMKENSLLLNGKTKMRESACKEYDLSIVNATMDPKKIVEMVENAQKYAEKNNDENTGVRMLFYGLSGTGKTEFARYIAETLHKPILLKRASDILSKWVGESEHNIRDAFEEAERTGSVLLFDEADSFFQDRTTAQHSWEITQVNEFLTQMEEFSGILICTTNLRNIMDPAMQRRFHILSEFKALNENGIKTLCSKYFPALEFTDEQINRLAKFNTATPGDFASIHGRYRFMNESEQNAAFITGELENLQKEKKMNFNTELKIGFTA